MRRSLVVLFVLVGMVGCSFDASEPPGTSGDWDLGDRFDASESAGDSGSDPMDTGVSTPDVGPSDMGATVDTGMAVDVGMSMDSGSSDAAQPDMSAMPDAGTMADMGGDAGQVDMGPTTGTACTNNMNCGAGEVCCPDLQGNLTCTLEADCLSGGACAADTDCAMNEECCDLSAINGGMLCLTNCFGQGGGGTPCSTNADCMGADVCCPNLSGSAECTPGNQCFSGGLCSVDADCQGMQQCCDLQFTKACFNTCGF